jgi:excinuclease UvrABC helicase subunit UvrB
MFVKNKNKQLYLNKKIMFDLFGKNHGKSIKQLMKEFDEMMDGMSTFKIHYDENPKIKEESGSDENGEWTKTTYSTPDGSFRYHVITTLTNGSHKQKGKKTDDTISKLKQELELCVEKQEFEKAVELRDKIRKFESNQNELLELQGKLDEAISKQDFESAIKLRDKINKMKS